MDILKQKEHRMRKGVLRMRNIMKIILNLAIGIIIGATTVKIFLKKATIKQQASVPSIYEDGFQIFNDWMKLKFEGKTLQKFFDDNRMKKVAIYGFGALGQRLYEDLKQLDVEITYVIDRNADNIRIDGLKVVTLDGELDIVDAIIVTPIQFFYDIEKDLESKMSTDIISIEDVVSYCM